MSRTAPYSELRKLTDEYFDVSSRVFLDDLISYHLDIEPKKITTDELQQLLTWLEIVSSLIIEDQKAVQEYLSRVKKLSGVSNG